MEVIEKLLSLYDNKSQCADALGISAQRLNGWIKNGYIPYPNGTLIEEKTKRKVKAAEVWQAASRHNK